MTNARMADPEILEKRFPVRLEEFSIRHGSGGLGKYSGGNGVIRKLRFLEPVTATTLCSLAKFRRLAPTGARRGPLAVTAQNFQMDDGLNWVGTLKLICLPVGRSPC
jgi:5-oxoprolinase (ATP-hydrolysing)